MKILKTQLPLATHDTHICVDVPTCLVTHQHNLSVNALRVFIYACHMGLLRHTQIIIHHAHLARLLLISEPHAKALCQTVEKSQRQVYYCLSNITNDVVTNHDISSPQEPFCLFECTSHRGATQIKLTHQAQAWFSTHPDTFSLPIRALTLNSEWHIHTYLHACFYATQGTVTDKEPIQSPLLDKDEVVRLFGGKNTSGRIYHFKTKSLPLLNELMNCQLRLDTMPNNKYQLIGTLTPNTLTAKQQ